MRAEGSLGARGGHHLCLNWKDGEERIVYVDEERGS